MSDQEQPRLDAEPDEPQGMSTQARVWTAIGVLVVAALAIWLATRGDGEPNVGATPTTSETATSTPSATPNPTPTATATATPTPSPTTAETATATATPTAAATTTPSAPPTSGTSQPAQAGDLVVAGDDGVTLVRDSTSIPLAGVQGPISIAFADRDGSVLFQADGTSIQRLVDGSAANVVDVADFSPIDPDGTTLTPHEITLMDVDSQEAQMVFTVEYRDGDTSTNADRTQTIVAATDGSGQQVVQTDGLFEGIVQNALGGGLRATITAGEGQGNLRVWNDAQEVTLGWDTAWDATDPDGNPVLDGPQLDDTGDRLAVATIDSNGTWRVKVVDTTSGAEEFGRDLDPGFVPIDLTDTTIVVLDTTADTSIVLDLGSDDFRTVPGRATIAR